MEGTKEKFVATLKNEAKKDNITVYVRRRYVYMIKHELLFGIMPTNTQLPYVLRFKNLEKSLEITCTFQVHPVSILMIRLSHIIVTIFTVYPTLRNGVGILTVIRNTMLMNISVVITTKLLALASSKTFPNAKR